MAKEAARSGSDNIQAGGGVKAGEKPRRLGKGLSSLIGEAVRVLPADLLGSGAGGVGGGAGAAGEQKENARFNEDRKDAGVSGTGLASKSVAREEPEVEGGRRLVMVEVDRVGPSRWQPRADFDDESLTELAESIKTTGLMQPIVVRVFDGTEERWNRLQSNAINTSPAMLKAGLGDREPGPMKTAAEWDVLERELARAEREAETALAKARAEGKPNPRSGPALYELVAGERRWRAAWIAGLKHLPAVVVEISDQEAAEWGLVENVQREDLSPFDKAAAFKRLSQEFGLTQEQIGKRVGIGRTLVTAHLQLLELEHDVVNEVRSGNLTMAHARLLMNSAVRPGMERIRLAQTAGREGWSYRKLEAHVRALATRDGATTEADDDVDHALSPEMRLRQSAHERQIAAVRSALSERLGTKVKIEGRAARIPGATAGRLVIDFYTLEQFEGLLAKMGVAK